MVRTLACEPLDLFCGVSYITCVCACGRGRYWALLQLQYFLYAPIILIVARFNLHIISVVLAEKNMRLVLDMFLMAGFGVVTYGVCSMAPEGFRLGFYAVAHVSVSVLHMIIAMNHFHMPMCAPRPGLAVGIAALWV